MIVLVAGKPDAADPVLLSTVLQKPNTGARVKPLHPLIG
jgi:hypothetical protein